jgi:hypothetical protein
MLLQLSKPARALPLASFLSAIAVHSPRKTKREAMEARLLASGTSGKRNWWAWVDLNHRPRPYPSRCHDSNGNLIAVAPVVDLASIYEAASSPYHRRVGHRRLFCVLPSVTGVPQPGRHVRSCRCQNQGCHPPAPRGSTCRRRGNPRARLRKSLHCRSCRVITRLLRVTAREIIAAL